MSGEKNLNKLLKSMKPELIKKEYVFCMVQEIPEGLKPLLVFKEKEGFN